MTEEEFRNGPPKPPENIANYDSYNQGYQQGLWKHQFDGVNLRDRFAIAALTGILSGTTNISDNDKAVLEYCYELADAMLEARKK